MDWAGKHPLSFRSDALRNQEFGRLGPETQPSDRTTHENDTLSLAPNKKDASTEAADIAAGSAP